MFARVSTACLPLAISLIAQSGEAQEARVLTLPKMSKCVDRTHPLLPQKWRGLYLMAPFSKAQLTLGDFVFDGSIPATRARLYGLRHGSVDLFIKGRKTYMLGHDGLPIHGCRNLGDTGLRPFRQDWLTPKAHCEGSAPVGAAAAEWWKMPSASKPSANWIWYETAHRSPFRLMFTQPVDDPAILGSYTFSYQARFEVLTETGLAAIAASCEGQDSQPEKGGRETLWTAIADMERSSSQNEAEIARLMPELSAACPSMPLPHWPERMGAAAFMTAPDFRSSPLPTEVLYDWGRKSQRTRMMQASGAETEDALMAGGHGYNVSKVAGGLLACTGGLPGPPRPNWPETGNCSCEAAIEGKTALAPRDPVRILRCPMTAPRIVWSWFAFDGRPVVFMETSAPGDKPSEVLSLIDYYAWVPGLVAPDKAFDMPARCPAPKVVPNHAPSNRPMQARSERCGACHLDDRAPR